MFPWIIGQKNCNFDSRGYGVGFYNTRRTVLKREKMDGRTEEIAL